MKVGLIAAKAGLNFIADNARSMMTELMEKAIDALRRVPDRRQDDIAQVVLELAASSGHVYQLSPEEEADLAQSEAEAARGEFATDEEVRAVWSKYGL